MKPTAKKTTPKKSTSTEDKASLNKEEIKELVEETVEEVLKEKTETNPSTSLREENSEEANSHPGEVATSIGSEEIKSESKDSIPTMGLASDEVSQVHNEEDPSFSGSITQPSAGASSMEKSETAAKVSPMPQTSENTSTTEEENKETVVATPVVTVAPPTTVESSGFSGNPADEPAKKSPLLGILIAIFAFLLAAGGGFWYLSSHNTLMNSLKLPGFTAPTGRPTTSVSQSTPTPSLVQKQVDVSSYKVSVLNGSGVAGEAAKVKGLLSGAGFSVNNTGNASSSDYTQTTISAKSSVSQDALDKLIQVLAGNYTVSTHPVTLSASDPEDIVVTVGAEK